MMEEEEEAAEDEERKNPETKHVGCYLLIISGGGSYVGWELSS